MTTGDILWSIGIGLVTGALSGYIVSYYFKKKDLKKEAETKRKEAVKETKSSMYELHMYMNLFTALLLQLADDIKEKRSEKVAKATSYQRIKEALLNEPYPTHLRLEDLEDFKLPDSADKAIRKANLTFSELRQCFIEDKRDVSLTDVIRLKGKTLNASLDLLKERNEVKL